jgi:hypothetical protein
LDKLQSRGEIELPAKQSCKQRGPARPIRWTEQTAAQAQLRGALVQVQPVRLQPVSQDAAQTKRWNEYVDRYHYLGYKRPFGCAQRYFIESARGVLGCVLTAGAAKCIGVRDGWIGWSEAQRLSGLPWVINNSRFVLFPWVQVQHLASHVLGQLARRVAQDYAQRWGYRPVLLETFVDPARYGGTCYRAAGWQLLGRTTGEGLRRPGRQYHSSPKLIFVRPLARDFRRQLCSEEPLAGRCR